jgi:hypothetical protein
LRARLAFVGDAKDGRRGGFLKGLDGCSAAGELVFLRLRAGSSIFASAVNVARNCDSIAQACIVFEVENT